MQVQLDIEFDQLVRLVKQLPKTQWTRLKDEVEKEREKVEKVSDLETLLLSAPTFTKDQLEIIESTRKAIAQWRTE
jgi:hypothetical protein